MSNTIHDDLIDLHYKLDHFNKEDASSKEAIQSLAEKINDQLTLDKIAHQPETNILEDIGLAATEFEEDHPRLSAALKNILLTLQNIGI